MRCFTALLTPGLLSAEFVAVTKSLTFEAAHRVGDKDVHIVFDVASEQGGRQSSCLERQNEETGITHLPVSEGGQATHV